MGLQSLCSVALAGGRQAISLVPLTCTFDLSAWTFYESSGSKGRMPYPDAPPQHKVNSFRCLTDVFEALWMTVQQVSQPILADHKMVAFYCKAGRHQSYALLIAFVMWSSHIHELQIWEAIISPVRNARLEQDSPCELTTVENLTEQERTTRTRGLLRLCEGLHSLSEC